MLLNIFLGYFEEAYLGESVGCDSVISKQLNHVYQDSQKSQPQNTDHSDKHCIASHCHIGHCAIVIQSQAIIEYSNEQVLSDLNTNLSPIDFVFDLLRPPISA